ncbi:hypothetical protein WG922_06950 [Ramlibacter sp. AN1015]|uniref:hypothetical protein n=1 Tax=Ramlibacter sp. AN1015 TaxID=3133428 RepID=UPI0030BC0DB1
MNISHCMGGVSLPPSATLPAPRMPSSPGSSAPAKTRSTKRPLVAIACALACGSALAQAGAAGSPGGGWQAGAVLDVSASSRALALGQRDRGLALGHSDLSAYGPLGNHLDAQLTAAVHSDHGKYELELDEAWVQTRTLPAGLQLRAGRFASQIGYLNEQHPHADDFVQRPLLYRAFFGDHWTDDGLRLNWTAATDLYLRLGAEVFRGKRLVEEADSASSPGAAVLSARIGGDIGASHSWQAGLSYLHNRRDAGHAHEAEEEGEEAGHHDAHEDDGHGDAHGGHGAAYSGRGLWLGGVTWKWAPDGNNSRQQVRVTYERAVVRKPAGLAGSGDRHRADTLSAVWRFAPAWEVGARTDALSVRIAHEDHVDHGRLREHALMLAYKPTHQQTFRVQATRQRDRGGFEAATQALQLQYILNFGAHAAHAF